MSDEYKLPTPDDFATPADWRESAPGRVLLARAYSRRFHVLAAKIERCSPADWKCSYELRNAAGELIIASVKIGFLQCIPHLTERVAWHTADDSNDPVPRRSGPRVVLKRHPVNLFNEVVGGTMVIVRPRRDGSIEIVDPNPIDGILPHMVPAIFANQEPWPIDGGPEARAGFEAAQIRQRAEACRFLGDAVLAAPDSRALAQSNPTSSDAAPMLLEVNLELDQVRYQGKCYAVSSNGALLLQKLVESGSEWLRASSLFSKPSSVKNCLPEPLRRLIESEKGKGYRLKNR